MRHYIFVMILMFLGVATTSYAQRTRKVHENTSTMHRKTYRWSKPRRRL